MPEGSVIVDGRDSDVEDIEETQSETTEQSVDEVDQTSTEESGEQTSEEAEVTETQSETEEEVKLTEKGTKLDPNPMSALNQELANERRRRAEYEAVLNDPERYVAFAKQAGLWKEPQSPPVEPKRFTVDDMQSAEDAVNIVNSLSDQIIQTQKLYEDKVRELEQQVGGISEKSRVESVANSISTDSSLVREKYPELQPLSPYAKDLEAEISKRYHQFNFDERTQTYTNAYPLSQIAEMVITPIRLAKEQAKDEAQTIVRHKSMGKVVKSGKRTDSDSNTDDSIAGIISRQIRK